MPFGDGQILIAEGTEIALYDLDGSQVWAIPGGGSGKFVSRGVSERGGGAPVDAWWEADSAGQLTRIPLDGSDPIVISIPDAIFDVSPGRRGAPNVAPVDGGAWFTNVTTVQFVTDSGELGRTVEVGPTYDDGVHAVEGKQLSAYDGYVYVTDADGVHYKIRSDGSTPPETSADAFEVPFTEGAGLPLCQPPVRQSA